LICFWQAVPSCAYWETRRRQIAGVLGEDPASGTVAMMNSYNMPYYSTLIAGVVTGWAELGTARWCGRLPD
jgi:hypothetical protein